VRGRRARAPRADRRRGGLPVQGDRPRRDLRRDPAGGPRRARRLEQAARRARQPHAPAGRAGLAVRRARARGHAAHGAGAERPGDRRAPGHRRDDGEDLPAARLPQARRHGSRGDGRRGHAARPRHVTRPAQDDFDAGNGQARIAALARVALVPLLLASEAFETKTSPPDLPLAEPALFAYAVYALVSLVVVLRARRRIALAPLAVIDTLLLVLVLYGEGGAPADMRYALSVPVLVAAFLTGPRLTFQLAVLALAGFVVAALANPTFGHEAPAQYVAIHAFDLAWRGALAVTLSLLLARRSARIRELAESRRSLVAQALGAEARARRELAYVLHDELVQDLLSAQQDIK